MEITPIKIETLSPVNYYYVAAAGGMRTSSFIGDIALKYATLRQLGYLDYPEPTKFQPTYDDLNRFDFWFTVAISEKLAFGEGSPTLYMKNMIRNTMHGIDYNGSNKYPNAREGSTMYKNFYFQQPIRPGNFFYCYLISKSKIDLPMTIRVGNGKTGILNLTKQLTGKFNGILNLYTLQNILKTKLGDIEYTFTEHLILQYYLIGMFSKEKIGEIYNEWDNRNL